MEEEWVILLGKLSVLIPIGLILLLHRSLERGIHLLGVFLAFSFVADMKKYIPILKDYGDHVYGIYVLVEICFYVWFIFYMEENPAIRKWRTGIFLTILPLWFVSFSGVIVLSQDPIANSIFDVASCIVLILLSAYSLLRLTHSPEPLLTRSNFWFLLGIFIYFFFSCFLFAFIAKDFKQKFWYIHSFFDISKIILFTVGVFVASRSHAKKSLL